MFRGSCIAGITAPIPRPRSSQSLLAAWRVIDSQSIFLCTSTSRNPKRAKILLHHAKPGTLGSQVLAIQCRSDNIHLLATHHLQCLKPANWTIAARVRKKVSRIGEFWPLDTSVAQMHTRQGSIHVIIKVHYSGVLSTDWIESYITTESFYS